MNAKKTCVAKKNNKRFVSFVIFFFLIWHKTDHSGTIQHIINVLLQDGTMLFIFAYVWLLHFRENRHHVKRKTGMVNFDWLTSDCIYYYILGYVILSATLQLVQELQNLQTLHEELIWHVVHHFFFQNNDGFEKGWYMCNIYDDRHRLAVFIFTYAHKDESCRKSATYHT